MQALYLKIEQKENRGKNKTLDLLDWIAYEQYFISRVITSDTDELKTISLEDFQRCYQKWDQRLHQCVAVYSNYLKDDNIDAKH